MTDILKFTTPEHRWLSNFYRTPIEYDGTSWDSAENAYQAAKCVEPHDKARISTLFPSKAKEAANHVKIHENWNQIKEQVMYDIILNKFSQHRDLQEKLLATDGLLVEGNTWGDTYWGVCKGVGENKLGKILMRIREELRDQI